MEKRKTYTSPAVKARWNKAHYKPFTAQIKPELWDRIAAYQEREQLSKPQFLERAIEELETH